LRSAGGWQFGFGGARAVNRGRISREIDIEIERASELCLDRLIEH